MIYYKNKCILYTPITSIQYPKDILLHEATHLLKDSAYICSKGKKISKPNLNSLTSFEADELEKDSRNKMKLESNNNFPSKGIMLKGIIPRNTLDKKPLKYSFSYLISDSKFYGWTSAIELAPEISKAIKSLPFKNFGRIIIQTIEKGFSLHKHVDSIYSINSYNTERRKRALNQYGIDINEYNNNINCTLVFLLKGDGIRLHCKDGNSILMQDDFYYFRPDVVAHSVDKAREQRIILRIEGVLNQAVTDLIEKNAILHPEKILTI